MVTSASTRWPWRQSRRSCGRKQLSSGPGPRSPRSNGTAATKHPGPAPTRPRRPQADPVRAAVGRPQIPATLHLHSPEGLIWSSPRSRPRQSSLRLRSRHRPGSGPHPCSSLRRRRRSHRPRALRCCPSHRQVGRHPLRCRCLCRCQTGGYFQRRSHRALASRNSPCSLEEVLAVALRSPRSAANRGPSLVRSRAPSLGRSRQ
mmetsp:Transcript_86018/g.240477  ORF Transcript_86018/g.240477 Transcript_86018/m.240477 type:complete len:203 (-) Transcript_86018:28-636(-)